ncbi:MAG: glycosyltransferase [Bacteroidales bacterium]|jgi:glycosyltransferase involved in cell wall biosynthesis|nr:glycosyltransferase [Bacteroidales bacterium]
MNILFTFHTLPVPETGGVQRITHLLMSGLEKRGHKCYFLHCYRKGLRIRLSCDNQPVKDLSDFLAKKSIQIIVNQDGSRPEFISKYKKISHSGVKLVSFLHNQPGYERLTASRKSNHWLKTLTKTLLWPLYKCYHRFNMYHFNKINYNYSLLLLLLYVDSYINDYLNVFKWANRSKLMTMPNPLTFSTFISKAEMLQKEKMVLVVSRLDEIQKRISLCLKVWKNVAPMAPGWKMVVVGDGPCRNEYERYVKKESIRNVLFTGQQNPYEYYRKAAIFMMTSRFEGFPLTLLEAAQMGIAPVVMDSFGALHAIVKNNATGIIVPNSDTAACAQAVLRLIEDGEKRVSMAEAAAESVRQFSLDSVLDKWERLFNQLTTDHSHGERAKMVINFFNA